jgi:hypothetical protein
LQSAQPKHWRPVEPAPKLLQLACERAETPKLASTKFELALARAVKSVRQPHCEPMPASPLVVGPAC